MMFLEEQIAEIDRDIAAKIHEAGLDEAVQLMQTVPVSRTAARPTFWPKRERT